MMDFWDIFANIVIWGAFFIPMIIVFHLAIALMFWDMLSYKYELEEKTVSKTSMAISLVLYSVAVFFAFYVLLYIGFKLLAIAVYLIALYVPVTESSRLKSEINGKHKGMIEYKRRYYKKRP